MIHVFDNKHELSGFFLHRRGFATALHVRISSVILNYYGVCVHTVNSVFRV